MRLPATAALVTAMFLAGCAVHDGPPVLGPEPPEIEPFQSEYDVQRAIRVAQEELQEIFGAWYPRCRKHAVDGVTDSSPTWTGDPRCDKLRRDYKRKLGAIASWQEFLREVRAHG